MEILRGRHDTIVRDRAGKLYQCKIQRNAAHIDLHPGKTTGGMIYVKSHEELNGLIEFLETVKAEWGAILTPAEHDSTEPRPTETSGTE